MASKKVTNNKCKFDEGEKVLCYEPDPAKTKVLYDSKVLKLVPEKDDQGRKFHKFLIHFQGWNSTWDRYVTDEFVLKDTEENRKLQKELAEEAQLTPGGHLYRRERKRRVVRTETKSFNPELSEDSADETSTVEEENLLVPIDTILRPKRKLPELNFPEDLNFHVGYSCYLTHEKNKLVRLPCQPNVVTLFEGYLKYLVRTNFSCNKVPKKGRTREVFGKTQIEKNYKICVEVLDSLRICFNYFLFKRLLINENEQAQYYEAIKMPLEPPVINRPSQNGEILELQDNVPNGEEVEDHLQVGPDYAPSVASQYSQYQGTCSDCSLTKPQCSKIFQDTFNKVFNEYVSEADKWKAVPDSEYYEEIKQPAVIYGVYHLLRFLDTLPKILSKTAVKDEKLSAVYFFCNGLLSYLSTQTHLFGIKYFMNAAIKEKELNETAKPSEETVKIHRKIRHI